MRLRFEVEAGVEAAAGVVVCEVGMVSGVDCARGVVVDEGCSSCLVGV